MVEPLLPSTTLGMTASQLQSRETSSGRDPPAPKPRNLVRPFSSTALQMEVCNG